MASLFVIQGRDQGKRFDLDEEPVTLGRDNDNVVQLHDSEVSRHHAEVRRDADGYIVTDLKSSNGIFVNGASVEDHRLSSGDRVQVGRTLMIFTAGDDSSSIGLASEVDIIGQASRVDGSRIVKAMSHEEGSQILARPDASESPWLARARSNLQVMYHTALAVSHTLDIDQLLHRIVELIFEWVEADRGCIMLLDQESNELLPKVSRHRRQRANQEKERLEISRTILDHVMEQREGVRTSDAKEDARFDTAASIVKMGVREAICVPMQGRYGIVGVIYIDTYTAPGRIIQRNTDKFSDEHLKLMIAIAHQAALAIEDTSYYSAMVQSERLAAMGQTIATLSHHIKNILQGIRGGSYLIEEGLKAEDNKVVRQGWAIVDKNQDKISNLVMDMLTFSKDREPDLVPSNINDLAGEVVELMAVKANDTGVDLQLHRSESIPELMFDPDLLHRAILNVVTNAIDACQDVESGRVKVSIRLSDDGKRLEVVVDDNGGGIEDEDVKKIFSVFESRKGARGTGLGLPVSEKIMREHGGDIAVESTIGSGSRFILSLPAVNPSTSPSSDTLAGVKFD